MKFNDAAVSNNFDIRDRRCVLTGAGGLIGAALAEGLIRAGAFVELVDINSEALSCLEKRLRATGTKGFRTHHYDLCDELAAAECFRYIATDGSIDALVNAVGIDHKVPPNTVDAGTAQTFSNYSYSEWKKITSGNLDAAFLATREACRSMESVGKGSIVNICSTYAQVGPDQRMYDEVWGRDRFLKSPAYSAAKAGVLGFTRAVAAHYRDTEIRVNALSPGSVAFNQSTTFIKSYSKRTISGRLAQPEELVGAAIFLCSEASTYITGSNLVVDGGWTAV